MPGFGAFAQVARELRRDVAAARARDPAERGVGQVEILATWPGIHALLAYRVAHALHGGGVRLLRRTISMLTRAVTGIELHPAARIGEGRAPPQTSATRACRTTSRAAPAQSCSGPSRSGTAPRSAPTAW